MTVGEYLKELRLAKGISQKELSGLTNREVSNAEISRLEAGIRIKPSPAILKLLAPHLGVPVSLLLAKAGYMDELPAGTAIDGHPAGTASVSGEETDRHYQERLQILEDERSALKKANLEQSNEAESYRNMLQQAEASIKQWEDKYDALSKQSPQTGGSSETLIEENLALKERNENLREESRRIKEETILLLEEASSLRIESDSYRKRLAAAEDAAKKAKIAQEAAEEELDTLKDKGVMFATESDEEMNEEFDRLRNELMTVLEQKNDILEEKEELMSKIEVMESRLNEISESGDSGLTAAAGMLQEMSELMDRTAEAEAEKEKLAQINMKMEEEIKQLTESFTKTETEKDELADRLLLLEQLIADLKDGAGESAPVSVPDDEARSALENEIADLHSRIAEAEAGQNRLSEEKSALEKELLAAKETVTLSTSVLETINNVQAAGVDLGQLFLRTARDADDDDLDFLGRLMQAMCRNAIKPSDKKSVMSFLRLN